MLKDRQSGVNIIYSRSVHKFSVDCANSYKGKNIKCNMSKALLKIFSPISRIIFWHINFSFNDHITNHVF